jgi:hypothetical protein
MGIQRDKKYAVPYSVLGTVSSALVATVMLLMLTATVRAGDNWDASDNTQWWFDPQNWNNNVLPPTNGTAPPAQGATDTDIVISTDTLPGGEGIVFDPSNNDPNFANAINLQSTLPAGNGPQYSGTTYTGYIIQQLYVGRSQGTAPASQPRNSMVTIKGDLTAMNNIIIGRSSGTRDVAVNASIVQKAGVLSTTGTFDLAQTDPPGSTGFAGYGNGTYDYQGGSLNVTGGTGTRLSGGSVTVFPADGLPVGAGGIAKMIIHNPATSGFVRTTNLVFNSFTGVPASTDAGKTNQDPDGVTKGVGIAEFHYANGGVRPIEVAQTLTINNGRTDPGATPATTDTNGVRSARLGLVLDSAPTVTAGVPQNLPLIVVDYSTSDFFTGAVTGSGDANGDLIYNNDRFFSNEFAVDPLAPSAEFTQGSVVSAVLGSTKYNWTISYSGLVTFQGGDAGADSSAIASIASTGGLSVVLMGLSTESVTPPGVPGDYNNNGIVDAADYTVWRDHLGQTSPGYSLPNEGASTGTVDQNDYTFWVSNFTHAGAGAGLGAGGAVPEPSTLMLMLTGVIGVCACRRHYS